MLKFNNPSQKNIYLHYYTNIEVTFSETGQKAHYFSFHHKQVTYESFLQLIV